MEENNIIICENCYEENESTRATCRNCGARLYKNGIKENNKDTFDGVQKEVRSNQKEIDYVDSSNSSNTVAKKFILVVTIMKFIGYLGAVIVAIVFMSMDEVGIGILSGIITTIITWLSTLIFEAIAEALNLLQDIKNKL